MPSIPDSRLQAEVDEAILTGIVSGGSGQSSPQASPQAFQPAPISVLTRPVSSGQDPATGFSFTKAKPIQQLDFRRPKQTQSRPLPKTAQAARTVINVAGRQGPSPKHVLNGPAPVPFPNVIPAHSQAYNHSTPNTTSDATLLDASFPRTLPNEVSMSTDDTLTDSTLNGTKPVSTAPVSSHSLTEMTGIVNEQPVNTQHRSGKTSSDFLTFVAGTPKITKSRRRKPKTGPATNGPTHNDTYTDDDLLRLFMYRRRQGQEELEYFRATQPEMEAEMEKLRDTSNDLSGQLQEAIQRETQRSAEVSKMKSNMPIWESKIKRLSEYVKGLANDQKRLREDAEDMHRQYQDVSVAKQKLHKALEDARKSIEQERVRSQHLEDDARHRIETLTQTIQHQSTQLQSDENVLLVERERSNRLEDQISRITASHGQLLELFTGHRDTITDKVDELLHQSQSIVPPNESSETNSSETIRPMLEQCIGILQELHEAAHVKPEDLQKLNDNMDTLFGGLTRSVEACEESSTSMEAGQKQLALAVQDQLRALSGNISSEHALSDQISDLREVRATVRERLQATESSLADARNEVIALRIDKQEQLRRIVTLETMAARAQSQPAEAPQTLLRIQELESRNRELESEVVTVRKEAEDLSSQLDQNVTDAREMTERLNAVQGQVEAANRERTRLQEEKSTSERQATSEREQLRKDFLTATNTQLEQMKSEHMIVIQQLKSEVSPAEGKLKIANKQLNVLKVEKEKSEKETQNFRALLKDAQNKKEAAIGNVKALKLHLKEMEVRMQETNTEHRDMQAMLNNANDQVKAKELEILALQASQATRPSSSRVVEQRNYIRDPQLSHSGHALRRDPQHASIDQSPSVRTANPKSVKHLANRPPVIEDSQPTESPTFVSLDDIMLENPFAAYAPREGSQTLAGDDLSYLFPSTPGAGSRVKTLGKSQSSQREASITRESTQPRGSVKDPRQAKRSTLDAGFQDTNPQARPSKVLKAGYPKQAKNLGPVIEDSQSPLLNGRSRKMTRRKSSGPKEDKYTRRFAQR